MYVCRRRRRRRPVPVACGTVEDLGDKVGPRGFLCQGFFFDRVDQMARASLAVEVIRYVQDCRDGQKVN